ncbi:hypothetical protein QBC46DRAFT_351451 [Diplogelasinospora grovesii]|uniref:Mitochondrial carrier protein pet8 n=1 Tax=Diplogelasinospora grovesii TaxID=303347 RepID=A0AAN6NEF6_9PEZI|nr:hypothetical protein QBC46DRAFT_351451 [Diplogelasinospora grovesii]
MTCRLLVAAAQRRTLARPAVSMGRRTIAQTASLRLKESASQDQNPEEFDKHKQDSLSKQKEGKGHWKPELASDSEEDIKADRMTPEDASEATMKRLQERTKAAAEETHKHGTSMRDGL